MAIDDPFMRMVEFSLRSNIFKNIIIAMEVHTICRRINLHLCLKCMGKTSESRIRVLLRSLRFRFGSIQWQCGWGRCSLCINKFNQFTAMFWLSFERKLCWNAFKTNLRKCLRFIRTILLDVGSWRINSKFAHFPLPTKKGSICRLTDRCSLRKYSKRILKDRKSVV